MTKKCIGCGATLQSKDESLIGYIDMEKYQDGLYCKRCFRLKNYNEYKEVPLYNINQTIIDKINKDNILSFFLIDILSINTETINTFNTIKGNKILVISKTDIIPKSIKENKITNFLRSTYNIKEEIIYLSSKKNTNINKIIEITKKYNNKAYILGYTNSGKSTLINTLTTKYNNNATITTSSIPNTTLDFMNIIIEDITLIDTPGFNLYKTFYDSKDYSLIKKINPKTYLKPITIQTKENTIILIEDKLSITTNNKNSLTIYMSNNLKIDKVYKDILGNKETLNIKIDNDTDLIIKGLGFINIKKKCNIQIKSDYNDLIEIRKSLFRKNDNND